MEVFYALIIILFAIGVIYYYRRKRMFQVYNADGSLSYDITKNGLRILGVYTSPYLGGSITIPITTKPNEHVRVVVGTSAYSEHFGSAKVNIDSISNTEVKCSIYSSAKATIKNQQTFYGYVRIIVLGGMT